jgi:hypothetical protein
MRGSYLLTNGKINSNAKGWIALSINNTDTGRHGIGVGEDFGKNGEHDVGVRVPVGESAGDDAPDDRGGEVHLESGEVKEPDSFTTLHSVSPKSVLAEDELDGDGECRKGLVSHRRVGCCS